MNARAHGIAWGCGAAMALGGCAVGPDYERPPMDLPERYRFAEESVATVNVTAAETPVVAPASDEYWWSQIGDPTLDELIVVALSRNQDLLIATARVEEYYGRVMAARAGLFPQVGAEFGGGRQRLSNNGGSVIPIDNPFNQVRADVYASWEIDLFGRIRRLTEAARAEWAASEQGRRATEVSVAAAVASAYITLRDLDNRLRIARETLVSREGALNVFRDRFQGGVVSEVEFSQSRSEYASAQVSVEQFRQQVALQENLLAFLLGDNPRDIPRGKEIGELVLPTVPMGLPSALLAQRPDLVQAEQSLVAANARIGAARAQYFPTISLTGLFGAASTALSGLWVGSAQMWSFGGVVSVPIFTAGAIAGDVRQAEARQAQALHAYRQAIQTAFREVADALVSVQRTQGQLDAKNEQVNALSRYALLARDRYEGGYTSYLEVLDSERALFAAQLDQSSLRGAEFGQLIQLYKALGGGWPTGTGAQAGIEATTAAVKE
ncbi:efflux transporter outer membrane subunit [Cupriavidus plantarum]|uniref:efflux transporter outer membrane subunit n=1 Tax=Cupriavidus plantarum TaxID=942865 RepID=UPI001B07D138|nr:efflux transporter outer membrane subunit [Cupriavidus plantarum]CAG2139812.1 Outer membrane protein OprM [Cupriavidus plantarum]SMR85663.1 outer membrane protein, multidrug efflux system [Cupriavidus plantarum]